MEDLLAGLNKEQKEAVTHDGGPLLIVAGAGTGKTTVITRRIAYLIAKKLALPSEILALTFTDKAAAEMEERVDELVPYGFVDTWISTFHAFGDRILRDHALDLGLTTDFRVLSKPEQIIFMQDNLAAFDLKYFSPLGNPTKHIDALLGHFSKLKDEMISPAEYLEYADRKLKSAKSAPPSSRAQVEGSRGEISNFQFPISNQNSNSKIQKGLDSLPRRQAGRRSLSARSFVKEGGNDRNGDIAEAEKTLEIARTYERYQELMAEAGNLDFGDQINMVINLFQGSPKVLEKYQNQFKYILVDEFQDTNYAQNELLKLLTHAPFQGAGQAGNSEERDSSARHSTKSVGMTESRSGKDSGLSFAKSYGTDKQARMTHAPFQGAGQAESGGGNITVVGDDDQCLPGHALVQTPSGTKEIRNVKVGDFVLTGIGKGHVGISRVAQTFKKKKKARLITFKTKSGKEVTVTSNHKMFCYLSSKPHGTLTYVYLMEDKKLGWRIGITNNLKQRLKFERGADRIVGIKACETLDEALYFETVFSLKYNIPTLCFKDRNGLKGKTEWLEKVFCEFDTRKSAEKLAADFDIDLDSHHYSPQSVIRGEAKRVKVMLEMNARRYRIKGIKNRFAENYKTLHLLSIETSDKKAIKILEEEGFQFTSTRGSGRRHREMSADLKLLSEKAERAKSLIDGILEYRFKAGTNNVQHRPAVCVNASNVLRGMFLPIIKGNSIVYDEVVEISSQIIEIDVYDLEIEKTHNFIAGGVVVHNSIYRFRGAAISNILQFPKDYPGCKQIVLTENYRSTQAILDSAYKLIKHNDPDRLEVKNNIVKKLISLADTSRLGQAKFVGKSVEPIHLHCDTLTAEADRVAKMIKDDFDEGKYSFKDFAILSRSRRNAEDFIHALNHYGIPYKFSGSSGLYSRPEIRLLINFAKVLVSSGDNLAFYHLLTSDVYGMEVSEAVKLNSESHRSRRGLEQVAKQLAKGFWTSSSSLSDEVSLTSESNDQNDPRTISRCGAGKEGGMSEKAREILERFLDDLKNFREESKKLTAGQTIYLFLKETGYLSKLVVEAEKSAEAQVAIQNIAKFFERIGDFEKVSEDKSIINFVHHLRALMDAGDDPAMAEVDPDLEAVSVLTVHGSKGLEFPVVFMVSLVSDSFPTRKRAEQLPIPEELIKESLPDGDWHLQEERRLFYVGMTRAKEILYLTSAEDYGGKRTRKVSQFVLEAIDKPALSREKVKLDKIQAIERFKKRDEIVIPSKFYDGKGLLTLNPHQIDDYLSCPKKFEYIHILRVPIMTHHSVIYGSAIHKAIENYYVMKKAGKKISADDLIEVFSKNWRSEGFITRDHEDKRFKQGKKSLAEFFAREEAAKILPDEVEAKFEISMKDLDVKIRGRFDAVYGAVNSQQSTDNNPSVIPAEAGIQSEVRSPKSNSYLEIRDFKTSEVENQDQADKKAKSNRQLSIYALAKETETGVIPEVSLYFVDSGLIGIVQKTEKNLDKVRGEIEEVVEGIKAENFKAAPGFQECSRCAYREICPFTLSK